jgi:hypothetical protein
MKKVAWIIQLYFPYERVKVYGIFDSEEEAREYAEDSGFSRHGNSYDVNTIIEVNSH